MTLFTTSNKSEQKVILPPNSILLDELNEHFTAQNERFIPPTGALLDDVSIDKDLGKTAIISSLNNEEYTISNSISTI